MTTTTYQMNYGDVDASMAEHILDSHAVGADRIGYMTLRKEVFTVLHSGQPVGFTTLTWKRGGSVKTGPTILSPDCRGKGIGPLLQLEIQRHVATVGGRKTYGTVSDSNERAQRYMLKAGYEVETRLKDHYYPGKNELIFGRLLTRSQGNTSAKTNSDGIEFSRGQLVLAGRSELLRYSTSLIALFDRHLVTADTVLTSNLASAVDKNIRHFSTKPKRVVMILDGHSLKGALVVAPKRGGAVKVNLLGNLECETILQAIALVLPELTAAGFRKLSIFLPFPPASLSQGLAADGWILEGYLREPYKTGIDVGILSKFLS